MACGWEEDYTEMREDAWPFDDVWGDEKEEVIKYLRIIYMDNNNTTFTRRTERNVKREATIILDWWWKERYGKDSTKELDEYGRRFGRWLLSQYHETARLNPINNRPPPPRR